MHPLLTIVGVIALFLAILWLAQRSFIYFPDGEPAAPAAVGLPAAEVVMFTTEDGLNLDAWFVPARQPSAARTIIVFNGNAGNRAHRARLAARFAEYRLCDAARRLPWLRRQSGPALRAGPGAGRASGPRVSGHAMGRGHDARRVFR